VQLFAQRAAARVRGFELDADNTAHVAEICRRLDGLPLAIELAAARMGAMTPADLAARLSWRFRLLRGGDRTAAARHRTLRAVVDWSYDLLDEPSRRVFEALSIFAGGFGLLDAERLLDRLGLLGDPSGGPDPDGLAIVLSLVDRSLVTVVGRESTNAASTTTYVLLDTMRTYGRERLAARGLLEQAQRAHADVFSTIAGEAGTHLYREGHAAAAERLGGAIDELRAAWGWAVNADLSLAARLVSGMAPYVEHRMPAEVGQWAECTLAAVEDTDANRPDLAGVYAVAAACARFSGDLARGRQAAERGLAIADDVDTAGYLRFLLCEVALFEGRLDDVQALASTVAALEPTAAVAGMVAVTAPLATAYAGDVTTALQRAEEMYAMSERTGPDILRAWATFVLGEVALDVDPDRARQLFVAALHQSRLLGDRYLSGVALVAAAAVESRHADDPARAIPLFCEVVEHWRAAGDWVHQWTTLRNVADLLVRLGVDEEAALLHGALSATDRGPIFGADAERMTAMRQVLEARLGADALAELTSRGGRLGDGDVLTVAQRALAEAARRRSDVASTSL
jgi:tetratricopeptide (TPR) repeat protein